MRVFCTQVHDFSADDVSRARHALLSSQVLVYGLAGNSVGASNFAGHLGHMHSCFSKTISSRTRGRLRKVPNPRAAVKPACFHTSWRLGQTSSQLLPFLGTGAGLLTAYHNLGQGRSHLHPYAALAVLQLISRPILHLLYELLYPTLQQPAQRLRRSGSVVCYMYITSQRLAFWPVFQANIARQP